MADLLNPGEAVGYASGARLSRDFGSSARKAAQAAGLTVIFGELRPRSLFYIAPRSGLAHGVAVLPSGLDADTNVAMIAVALGFHLDPERRDATYIEGEPDVLTNRHRRAHLFARGFVQEPAAAPLRPDAQRARSHEDRDAG